MFDGNCALCRRWVSRLGEWDTEGRLELVPYQDASVGDRFPWIPGDAYRSAVQVLAPDGRTWSGAAGVEYLTHVVPRGRALSWLFRVPGARTVADRLYRWIAAGRGGGSCDLHCG